MILLSPVSIAHRNPVPGVSLSRKTNFSPGGTVIDLPLSASVSVTPKGFLLPPAELASGKAPHPERNIELKPSQTNGRTIFLKYGRQDGGLIFLSLSWMYVVPNTICYAAISLMVQKSLESPVSVKYA